MMSHVLLLAWLVLTAELGFGLFNVLLREPSTVVRHATHCKLHMDDGVIALMEEIQDLKFEIRKLSGDTNGTSTVHEDNSDSLTTLKGDFLRLQEENRRLREKIESISNTPTPSKELVENFKCNCGAPSEVHNVNCDTVVRSCEKLTIAKNCPPTTIQLGVG